MFFYVHEWLISMVNVTVVPFLSYGLQEAICCCKISSVETDRGIYRIYILALLKREVFLTREVWKFDCEKLIDDPSFLEDYLLRRDMLNFFGADLSQTY